MRAIGSILLLTFATLAIGGEAWSAERTKIPLNILYLSRAGDADRSAAFTKFLSAAFVNSLTAQRDEFEPRLLDGVDVVLMDWSQQERASSNYPSPLGSLESWTTPLVLLGSAGLIQARPWSIIGGAG